MGTVVLGGNEPIYTHGLRLAESALPYIIDRLIGHGIRVAMVTSGPSATLLDGVAPSSFAALEMLFVSLDAPDAERHDANRGAALFRQATAALEIARARGVDSSILYCATATNFTVPDVRSLVALASDLRTRLRVNTLKPSNPGLLSKVLDPETFIAGFQELAEATTTDLVDDPSLRRLFGLPTSGSCPCGTTTFRISHMREDGSLPVAPCIYVEAARAGDLTREGLCDILEGTLFRSFARPREGAGTDAQPSQGYGCRAQGVLQGTLTGADPLADAVIGRSIEFSNGAIEEDAHLRDVFGGYLCTWMGRPR